MVIMVIRLVYLGEIVIRKWEAAVGGFAFHFSYQRKIT